jgi:Uma2 family endonuclease
MRIEVEKRRFTVDEYHRMCETGVIGFEERTELIDGEIIKMTSPSYCEYSEPAAAESL